MLPRQSLPSRKSPARKARPLPQRWLMVDARLGDAIPRIIAAMPPRSGIIVRPYALDVAGRDPLIRSIRRVGRARRHLLLLSGSGPLGGYDGWHAGGATRRRAAPIISVPVHNRKEAMRARRWGADIAMISPIFATRSHPDGPTLGVRGFASLAASVAKSVRPKGTVAIALGGMSASRFARLRHHGAHGWAAINGWQAETSA